jgi:hypothetical protein
MIVAKDYRNDGGGSVKRHVTKGVYHVWRFNEFGKHALG